MIKVTRTMFNQFLIGNTEGDVINKPYSLVPTVEGIQLVPLDLEIVGVEIDKIELTKDKIMYVTNPSKELRDAYIKATTKIEGITTPSIIV